MNAQGFNRSELVTGAAVFIIAAGIIHLALVTKYRAQAPPIWLFFALGGTAEVAWGITFWRRPSLALYRVGVVMAGWFITLWAITRVLPAPFGYGPWPVEIFGVVCKLSEVLGIAALTALAVSGATSRETRISALRTTGVLLAAALIGGWLTYRVAIAAEPMFPRWKAIWFQGY